MEDVPSDELFQNLPRSLRRRIDDTFEHGLTEGRPNKRRKVSTYDTAGGFIPEEGGGFIPEEGGFIRDDDLMLAGGGFIPDEPVSSAGGFVTEPHTSGGGFLPDDEFENVADNATETIALSSIPPLLGRLGLDPEDEEVMQVFRNAATGWSNPDSGKTLEDIAMTARVSKEDWRSVCAVLLEDDGKAEPGFDDDVALQEEGEASDDAYESDQVSVSGVDEDEEYTNKPKPKPGRRSTRRARVSDDESDEEFELTPAQKRTCARDFERFFAALEETSKSITAAPQESKPASSSVQPGSTIRIKHIQHVASLLGEKLKAEDILEMLSAFSSAPDKASVSLADFEKIMIEAKLV